MGGLITTNSGAAQIIAAGNLAITATGVVANSNSSLLAGGNIAITADTVNNFSTIVRRTGSPDVTLPANITAGGTVNIVANLLNNGTITPGGIFNGSGDTVPQVNIVGASGQGGRGTVTPAATPVAGPLAINSSAAGAGGGKTPIAAGIAGVGTQAGNALNNSTATGKGVALNGTIAAPIIGSTTNPINTVGAVNPNAATNSNGLVQSTQVARIADGFNGIATPGVLGVGGRAGSFVFDFLRQFNLVGANGSFSIAGGGRLFTFNDSPDTKFLFTTNPGFASVGALLDSSFFFDQLGVDRGTNFTRLGDGFFRLQLITQQIRAATSEAQLPQFGDTLDQAKGLLESALAQKDRLKLSLGVALTGDQIANLTSSIVWYVKSNIAGRDVLLPVVYLAASDTKAIKGGAIISGTNVVAKRQAVNHLRGLQS